jgi:molybdenum cofactor biosynthesis enzyme MoaA
MIIDLTGEVVPCCFWAGYGNSGKPLGNTNVNTIDEIWNGEGYRELRAKMASGDLDNHPCGSCMAYRWANGVFPRFTWPAGFVQENGHCYLGQISEEFVKATQQDGEPVILYEDEKKLPLPDSPHEEIRSLGMGRYSIWNGWLYFSSSDNDDPLTSGRRYRLVSGQNVCEIGGLKKDSPSGRNLVLAYNEFLRGEDLVESQPSMISLISTADCNIDCPACSQNIVRLTKVQHRPDTVPAVLSKIQFLSQFIWHGGEPYLIKSFRDFIDKFKTSDNPNLTFGFTSNGTMIVANEAEKLKKFPRINASVSMDSFNRTTFEKIRAGAPFERVWQNVQRLIEMHDAPTRIFSVGMIICKSNILELPSNLRFAFDHDVGLNLSPIVLYPVTEQLNCFSNFEDETAGWEDALSAAAALVEQAKFKGGRAIARVDPSGMVQELRRIFEDAQNTYSGAAEMLCEIVDEHESLRHMRRPAIIIYDHSDSPRAYAKLRAGAGPTIIRIPRDLITANQAIRLDLVHDVMEPNGTVVMAHLTEYSCGVRIYVPQFQHARRAKNINWANYGNSTPDGNYIRDPAQIHQIYRHLYKSEIPDLSTESSRVTLIESSVQPKDSYSD